MKSSKFWTIVFSTMLCLATSSQAIAVPHSDESIPSELNLVQAPISASGINLAEQIATQMAPLVVINPNEQKQCCFPSNALLHWRTKVILSTKNPTKTFDPTSLQWKDGELCDLKGIGNLPDVIPLSESSSFYLTACTKADALYQRSFEQVPCWCELYWEKPFLQVKYWFWWPFNDHPNDTKLNLFDHEGDWEHIELRATVQPEGKFRYFYYFDRHGRSHVTLPPSWETSIDGLKQHPIIWAAEGSHVPYERNNIVEEIPLPKGIPGITTLLDNVADSDIRWNTFENLRFMHRNQFLPIWTFKGQWGSDSLTPSIPFSTKKLTDAPTGPAARARFANSNGSDVFP